MIGVFEDHDLIARPVPIRDDVVIERGDVPKEIAKPETFPVSSRKHEYMIASKATGEAPVCPRMIEVVMCIVGTTIMSNPLIVRGVNVRHFRMAFLVRFCVVFGRGRGLLASWSSRSLCGSRTVGGNVSTSNRLVTAAAWLVSALLTLRESSHANQNK